LDATLVVAQPRFVVGEEHLSDQVATAAYAGLVENALQVLLHRVRGYDEIRGDLGRRATL